MEFSPMPRIHHAPFIIPENTFKGQTKSPTTPLVSARSPYCFTKSQFALALAIQKSKPHGLSTSEYCRQLKTHIKINKPLSSRLERYVDTAEFWKDQYTKLHVDTKVLEDKVRCLEMQHQHVQRIYVSNNPSSNSVAQDIHMEEIRPCLDDANQAHVLPSGDRRRSETVEKAKSHKHEDVRCLDSLTDDTRLRLSRYAGRIGRQRTKLELMLPIANNLDEIEQLAQYSCETIELLDVTLSHCCVPLRLLHWNKEGGTQAILERVIDQIGLTFLSCFKALTELCRTILGRGKRNRLVYQMVMIFNRAVNLLRNFDGVQVDDEIIFSEDRICDKRPVPVAEYAVSKYLAEMLASVAYALDWRVHQNGHCELLEGILFSVLERTGHLVSNAVFSEHVENSKNPGNITNSGSEIASSWILNPEARYILQVLYAALGGPDRRDLVVRVLAASDESKTEIQTICKTSSELSVHSSEIVSRAKMKIQNTLIKSCVGGSDLKTMKIPLALPSWSNVASNFEITHENNGPDWFIETVWELIGCDNVGTF